MHGYVEVPEYRKLSFKCPIDADFHNKRLSGITFNMLSYNVKLNFPSKETEQAMLDCLKA